MKAAYHHLPRIDEVVMHSRHFTRPESTRPTRLFQLTSKTRLVVSDRRECEEAILEVTQQKVSVLQILERLSLGVQHAVYSLDDLIAVGQEQLEKFDVRPKRHLANTFADHNAPPA
jgi:hypothetical protein